MPLPQRPIALLLLSTLAGCGSDAPTEGPSDPSSGSSVPPPSTIGDASTTGMPAGESSGTTGQDTTSSGEAPPSAAGSSSGRGEAESTGQPPGPDAPEGCEGGSEANFELVGWATQAGGTTGGKGGDVITVATGAELQQALDDKQDSATPLTIWVSGVITPENAGVDKIDVKDVSDVSILGMGEGAELAGIGIKITRASNIVLRNLRIHHVDIGDKDAIGIEGPADHIWVDHCELYADYEGVDKDHYDGLLDAKGEAEYITYSWNYLHDSWKTSLVGSSESDVFDRKITMHHNHYSNCNSRLPLYRGGQGHIFNNYYEGIVETGINSRIGACLLVESNYFLNTRNPWLSAYSDELGGADLRCNLLEEDVVFDLDADDEHEILECEAEVPYDTTAVLTRVDRVPDLVRAFAGVGKLDDPAAF